MKICLINLSQISTLLNTFTKGTCFSKNRLDSLKNGFTGSKVTRVVTLSK